MNEPFSRSQVGQQTSQDAPGCSQREASGLQTGGAPCSSDQAHHLQASRVAVRPPRLLPLTGSAIQTSAKKQEDQLKDQLMGNYTLGHPDRII